MLKFKQNAVGLNVAKKYNGLTFIAPENTFLTGLQELSIGA
jgi:hypothetical protein